MVSVKGEKRVRINEMGAGKEYGERDQRTIGPVNAHLIS